MTETVTVRHAAANEYDSDGNPVAAGEEEILMPIEVAPGNTLLGYGVGADLDDVAYTVYFELGTEINDDDELDVRGRTCRARVSEWVSAGLGGLAVLARSTTGASSR